MRTGSSCVLALVILGCASKPPESQNAPKTASTASAEAPADSTSAPETASPAKGEFHAEVAGITDSTESILYKSVKMLFKNTSGKACEVTSYELEWPGGKKLVNTERSSGFRKFIVPAGGSRQRSLRVHPSDGDVSTLDVASAKLHADCN
jgi:hypothetical protein